MVEIGGWMAARWRGLAARGPWMQVGAALGVLVVAAGVAGTVLLLRPGLSPQAGAGRMIGATLAGAPASGAVAPSAAAVAGHGAESFAALGGPAPAVKAGGSTVNRTDSAATGTGSAATLGDVVARKVEETAALSVRVTDVADAFAAITAAASGLGGYVQSSSLQTGDGQATSSANLVVAVPQDQLAAFEQQVEGLGKILSSTAGGQDVTDQYVDIQGRLTALQAERQSYITLLGKATAIGDILQIQDALTAVQAQIEDLTGQLREMDALTAMATVTVNLVPPVAVVPPPPPHPGPLHRVSASFAASVQALGAGATSLALALAWALPWGVLAAGLFLAVRRLVRPRGPAGT